MGETMSHIKVQFSLLKDINLTIRIVSKNILEAKDDFKDAISKLDWEVKAQSDISVRAARAVGELRCYNTALNWYSNYLNTVYAKYSALENYDTRISDVGDVMTYSSEEVFPTQNEAILNDIGNASVGNTTYKPEIPGITYYNENDSANNETIVTVTPESVKMDSFVNDSQWSNGTEWGGKVGPQLSKYKSSGCCAYAADFAKYVFDKDSPRDGTPFSDLNDIRPGDILEFDAPHWFVVLERNGDNLKVAEANVGNPRQVRVSNLYNITSSNTVTIDWGKSKTQYTLKKGYHFM